METETLKLEKSKAIKLFRNASEELKAILIDTFGKECFSGKITDRIKTFEDALNEADDDTRKQYLKSIDGFNTPDEVAYKQMKLITKVLRGDWEPDWDNQKQRKWYPWFVFSAGSGFAFSTSIYYCALTGANVGSRLCFQSEELSNYFGKQFINIIREFLTITK